MIIGVKRGMKKKLFSVMMLAAMLISYNSFAFSAAINPNMPRPQMPNLQAAPNARTIDFAFVLDGPSDKNVIVTGL